MPKRKRSKTTPGVYKEKYSDGKNTGQRKIKDKISNQRKLRKIQTVNSSISMVEPVRRKKKYNNLKKSRGKSKCTCNKNGITKKRKDAKTHHTIQSLSDSSESMEYVDLNDTPNPLKYNNSVITIYSSDSCCDEEADFNPRPKQCTSQFHLDITDSQKYKAIAELQGVTFVKNNPGLTTEISFKPAVVMHVKKKTSTVSLEAQREKCDENIIVVNPSNDLLCDLSGGKIQRLYKTGATGLLRQAMENHSQSFTNVLNMKSSMNFTNLESQRNISQQNLTRNISRQVLFSQLTQDSKCNVLRVKSSTNFTNLQFRKNSDMTVQTSLSKNEYKEILSPQPIQECSINSFATFTPAWRASQGHISGDHGSVVRLTKRDSQTFYGMGDRVSRTLNSKSSQHSSNPTFAHRR